MRFWITANKIFISGYKRVFESSIVHTAGDQLCIVSCGVFFHTQAGVACKIIIGANLLILMISATRIVAVIAPIPGYSSRASTPLLSFVRAFSGDPASVHQRHFLESIPVVYAAVIRFAARCAELAERLAGGETDAGRRGELERFWRRKKSTPALGGSPPA